MKNLLTQVENFLDQHESAPSAWCLVRAFFLNISETTEAECCMAYERGEGENDSERNDMLRLLNPQQLQDLAAVCLEITLEKLEESEEE